MSEPSGTAARRSILRVSTGPDGNTRTSILLRAQFRCEVCGDPLTGPKGMSIHHRKPRRMGGTRDKAINSPANLMAVCGSGTTGCHGHLESRREWAIAHGYIVPSWDNPADTPVIIDGMGSVYLHPEGGYSTNPS